MNDWYRDDEDESVGKSKTRVKKEMHALQDLGEQLTHLKKEQLAALPLSDELRTAIQQAQGMEKKREALRRQLQYIGKLMRQDDTEEIQAAYNVLQERHHRSVRSLHLVEQWRDQLIAGDDSVITQFINQFPDVDRQQLRHLVRGAKQDLSQQKPPAHARKLFKLIRDGMEGE